MNGADMGAWAWAGMALMAVITVAIRGGGVEHEHPAEVDRESA